MPQVAQLPASGSDARQKPVRDDDRTSAAVGKQIRVVALGEQRRERDRNGADLDRSEERRDELGRIWKHQCDPLLGLDAQRAQRIAGPIDHPRDVRVRLGLSGEADRGPSALTFIAARVNERDREVETLGRR